jgi:hypothetical protein
MEARQLGPQGDVVARRGCRWAASTRRRSREGDLDRLRKIR